MDIGRILPDDSYQAAVTPNANNPSAANPFATVADTLYGGNNTVGANRVATLTNTLTFQGGTTIHTLTSGGSTITAGTGQNPVGFGSFGNLELLSPNGGAFDGFGGIYEFGGFPVLETQVYDNTLFVEKAGHTAYVADFSGTDRPYATLYYADPNGTRFTGIEANFFGTRVLDQNPLNRLSALSAPDGIAFLSGVGGNGYIGTADQTGFASWIGTTLNPSLNAVLTVDNQSFGEDLILNPPLSLGDGVANNSPVLYLRGNYDSNPGPGVTATNVDTAIYTEVTLPFGNLQSQLIIEHDGAQAYRIAKASAGGGSFDHLWEAAAGSNTMNAQITSDGTVDYTWDNGGPIGTAMTFDLSSATPNIFVQENGLGNTWVLQSVGVTGPRTYDLQDASGVIAFLSDITNGIYGGSDNLTVDTTVGGAFDLVFANTGDFERTGDILLTQGADRLIGVKDSTGPAGYNLTIEAGGGGAGLGTGGDIIMTPGTGGSGGPGGAPGDIRLNGKSVGSGPAKGSSIFGLAGDSDAQSGGDIEWTTGDSNALAGPFTGGDFSIITGNGPSGRGNIAFINGTEGVAGQIWTSIGTAGEGAWAAPAVRDSGQTYVVSNDLTLRTINANAIPGFALRDLVCTLIRDLAAAGVITV